MLLNANHPGKQITIVLSVTYLSDFHHEELLLFFIPPYRYSLCESIYMGNQSEYFSVTFWYIHIHEMKGTIIQKSDQEKDLGIIVSRDGKFNCHADMVASKANRCAGMIRQNAATITFTLFVMIRVSLSNWCVSGFRMCRIFFLRKAMHGHFSVCLFCRRRCEGKPNSYKVHRYYWRNQCKT